MKATLGRQVLVQKERFIFSCCPGKMVDYVPSRLPVQACSSYRKSEGKASFLNLVISLAFELGFCPFILLAFGIINVKTSPALSWPVGEMPLVIPECPWYQDQWGGEEGSCRLWRGIADPPSGPWDAASLSPPLHVGQVSTCLGEPSGVWRATLDPSMPVPSAQLSSSLLLWLTVQGNNDTSSEQSDKTFNLEMWKKQEKEFTLSISVRNTALLTPWFQFSDLQNYKIINCQCLKPLDLC